MRRGPKNVHNGCKVQEWNMTDTSNKHKPKWQVRGFQAAGQVQYSRWWKWQESRFYYSWPPSRDSSALKWQICSGSLMPLCKWKHGERLGWMVPGEAQRKAKWKPQGWSYIFKKYSMQLHIFVPENCILGEGSDYKRGLNSKSYQWNMLFFSFSF